MDTTCEFKVELSLEQLLNLKPTGDIWRPLGIKTEGVEIVIDIKTISARKLNDFLSELDDDEDFALPTGANKDSIAKIRVKRTRALHNMLLSGYVKIFAEADNLDSLLSKSGYKTPLELAENKFSAPVLGMILIAIQDGNAREFNPQVLDEKFKKK